MKIRIRGNSIRFRLTKSEVQTFCANGIYEERTQFPNGIFSYALEASETTEALSARFQDQKISIQISKDLVEGWATNSKISFSHNQQLSKEKSLSLLVEKDFVCMDESVEDQSDNYPNPKIG